MATRESMPDREQSYRRDPVSRAIQTIEYLAQSASSGLGVRELARHLCVSPSSANHLLAALVEANVLEQKDGRSAYEFTSKFIALARNIGGARQYAGLVKSALAELAEVSGETALFGEYDAETGRLMFTSMAESRHPVRFVARLREWMPLVRGASGIAILAFLEDADQKRLLAAATDSMGSGELDEAAAADLQDTIVEARRTGYAMTVGQRVPGAVGIFAPVFGRDSHVVATLGLNIPLQRFDESRTDEFIRLVKSCAETVHGFLE